MWTGTGIDLSFDDCPESRMAIGGLQEGIVCPNFSEFEIEEEEERENMRGETEGKLQNTP